MLIFDDGLVYDVSVTAGSLQDTNLLLKLPKSEQYFGYSDDHGVIYFIHSDTEKIITKYHKSFNNKGHITVQNSKRSKALMKEIVLPGLQFQYNFGVLMGNRFWTFGGFQKIKHSGPQSKFGSSIPNNQTTIWRIKKQVWTKGPELDITSYGFLVTEKAYFSSFSSVINSTSIILIGRYTTVVCVNIVTNRWTNYPDFPYIFNNDMVAPTVTFDKNGKRYVYISRKHFNSKFHL